jgi:hypothetical protein
MNQTQFERLLDDVAIQLTEDMRAQPNNPWFSTALSYEQHVRQRLHDAINLLGVDGLSNAVNLNPSGQTFPDVPCGEFGVEVKFTKDDKWVSIANSVRETKRVESVKIVYLMFGKMGGLPESRWMRYEDCVVHVRTSHEPRFQVDMTGEKESLFKIMGISYDDFRKLDIMDKMTYIRKYARMIHPDGRLWWLEDTTSGEEHSTSVDPVLYTSLDPETKVRYRAEATLLCPKVLKGGNQNGKYNDVVMFMLTYHGVLCHQARDLFSAGSVARMQQADGRNIPYKQRAFLYLQDAMAEAAQYLDPALFKEYWETDVAPDDRLAWWLNKADEYATDWTQPPSSLMFLDYQRKRKHE